MSSLFAILLVLLLAPPAMSVSAQNDDDLCRTVIIPLIQQSGADPVPAASVFGCMQDVGGYWSMRTVADTQPTNDTGDLAELGKTLQMLIDEVAMNDAFTYAVRFDRRISAVYTLGPNNVADAADLGTEPIGAAPSWLNNYVDNHTRAMEAYLLQAGPEIYDLVSYMQWFISTRDTMLSGMTASMNPTAESAFLANWGYQQFPWFWQLADQEAIRAYTGHLVTTEAVPTMPVAAPFDLAATFSPSPVTVQPSVPAELIVAMPRTDFSGGFHLTVTLPLGVDLVRSPVCQGSQTCADGTLELTVDNGTDGATHVSMSGVIIGEPAQLVLGIAAAEGMSAGNALVVMAAVSFDSRAAGISGSVESNTAVVVVG